MVSYRLFLITMCRYYANIVKSLIIVLIVLCSQGCQQETERNTDYKVHGIDVSRYQGNIDWKKVAKDTIHFAFIKATEGGDYQDPNFKVNWKSLENSTIKRGAYHFFIPTTDPKKQLDNFYLNVSLKPGDLPPVVDFETTKGLSNQRIHKRLKMFVEGLEEKYNVKPIIYTNLKLYYAHIAGRFDHNPIWIARYNKRSPLLSGNQTWTIWQYGDRGRVDGIHGYVDLNVFDGSLQDLDTLGLKEDPFATQDAL